MIKNIIFDLSEVIISGYHGVEYVISQNTNIAVEDFLKRKMETLDMFFEMMRGKHLEDEYCEYLLKDMNSDLSKEKLKELIRRNLNIPIEGTMKIIKKLKDKYNLILLSDHVKEWMEYIFENNSELSIFEHQYFSYEYGLLKTDEGCFEHVLKDLEINPEETIFIDDCQENMDNARKCGIEGILFKNAKDLEQELEKRGIF